MRSGRPGRVRSGSTGRGAHPPHEDGHSCVPWLPPKQTVCQPAYRSAVSRTVLVVDDDDSIRDLLASFLADEGYTVVCATDGAQALELVTDKVIPDLLLLDIGMPVVNGPEFVGLYRRICEPPHAPIIVITARGDGEAIAKEMGAETFVNKPFELEALGAAVKRCARVER